MEKNLYRKPMMVQEDFVPHEYVATCYKVKCDIPRSYYIFEETNGQSGLQVKAENGIPADKFVYEYDSWSGIGSFTGCNHSHSGVLINPEKNAYYVQTEHGREARNWTNAQSQAAYPSVNCFWWKQTIPNYGDVHASLLGPGDVDSSNPRTSD